MALNFRAGQILTPDDLMAIQWRRVSQGTDQSVTSSTTLVESSIVVPVSGITLVLLRMQYTSGGGGIVWDWDVTGGTVGDSNGRWVLGHGQSTTGDVLNSTSMQLHRSGLTTDRNVGHFTTQSPNAILEEMVVDGAGELTLRFAQNVSNASATLLNANSYARYLQIED